MGGFQEVGEAWDERVGQLEREAREHPALYPFGTHVSDFLDAGEETGAPFERRLRSVWRYIVRRVKRFAATLKPREAAIIDCEDIVHTVAAQLLEKDDLWDPSRGKYSTFVEKIIQNVLSTCHEQARAVSGPANSFGRLRGYHARAEAGTLTRGMQHTMLAISRVMEDFDSIAEEADPALDLVDVQALRRALRDLDGPIQVWAFVHKYGLFQTTPLTFKQIAAKLDIKESQAKALVKAARMTIRRSLNHETV